MINVAIVEDDAFVRESLQEFINDQSDMFCSAAKESVEAFLRHMNEENVPDVILMDIGLPGMSGISGVKLVKERFPEVNMLMLTVYNDANRIFRSLCAGASGYLLKNTPFPEIRESIEIVNKGGACMSPQIARKVVEFFQTDRKKEKDSPLTQKEKEIVMCLVDGLSYKMIADKECISLETVRSHIKNIYKKLQVHSKAEVIKKSLEGEI
ncbi:MAG: response regulator transcription factor [Bacteroidales bacterium]|nr:response regulator transcription factor [Bacteroidales bacterium]